MNWWGKIIGAFFGFLLAGPLGALLGLLVGSLFDKSYSNNWAFPYSHLNPAQLHETQKIFFSATFMIMGHIAKADGRISEDEIRQARVVMQHMRLTDKQQQQAIEYFKTGKQINFDLSSTLAELMKACHQNKMLLRMFSEIQLQAAISDQRSIAYKKIEILNKINQRFGFAPIFTTNNQQHYQYQNSYQTEQKPANTLRDAYALLAIDESATNSDIKRAYRRQMSQNHPDKLIAQGLPEEMIKIATDKTQKIQAAYEQIRLARGM